MAIMLTEDARFDFAAAEGATKPATPPRTSTPAPTPESCDKSCDICGAVDNETLYHQAAIRCEVGCLHPGWACSHGLVVWDPEHVIVGVQDCAA